MSPSPDDALILDAAHRFSLAFAALGASGLIWALIHAIRAAAPYLLA